MLSSLTPTRRRARPATSERRALRVAFDARSLRIPVLRGWDRYTVGLVGELVRLGLDVTLFHRESEPLHAAHVAGLGCRIQGLPDRGGVYWEQISVPRALRRGNFDLFHAPAEQGVPIIAPCPVVLTYHSVTTKSYRRLIRQGKLPGRLVEYLGYEDKWFRKPGWRAYSSLQLHRTSHFLTPSEYCRSEVIELLGVRPERVTATPLAVHDQFRRPRSSTEVRNETLQRLGVEEPFLLFVGGYEPHKNARGLLRAFAKVRDHRRDLSLVLVGSKSCPIELKSLAAQLGIDHNVVFLVNLKDELTDLYDAAETFVSLSWRETFCLPALEAMTRGVPVVASDWGATPEVVRDGGICIDPRDPDAAVSAILKSLNHDERERLVKRAAVIASNFDWANTASWTLDVYRQLIEGSHYANQRPS